MKYFYSQWWVYSYSLDLLRQLPGFKPLLNLNKCDNSAYSTPLFLGKRLYRHVSNFLVRQVASLIIWFIISFHSCRPVRSHHHHLVLRHPSHQLVGQQHQCHRHVRRWQRPHLTSPGEGFEDELEHPEKTRAFARWPSYVPLFRFKTYLYLGFEKCS